MTWTLEERSHAIGEMHQSGCVPRHKIHPMAYMNDMDAERLYWELRAEYWPQTEEEAKAGEANKERRKLELIQQFMALMEALGQ